jgi:IclR family pca regulon transcriptional regulator
MAVQGAHEAGGDDVPENAVGDVIESVERALRILLIFSHEHPSLTLSEAARLAGLSRGTARRILLTFHRLGFVRLEGRQFFLTPRVLRLGYGYLSSLPVWELVQPHLRSLADSLNESSSAATLDGEDIVYVARVPSRQTMSLTLTVGSRLPAYATSMGRVLLAGLPKGQLERYLMGVRLTPLTPKTITDQRRLREELAKVHSQGYAVVDGEREAGVRSVAAPVYDRSATVVAAVNVSTSAARVGLREIRQEFVPKVVATARRISDDLSLA